MWHAWERRESVQGFSGKSRGKETSWKTKGYVGRWSHKGSWGELFGGCGLNWTGSGQGSVADCCECGDEPSGSCVTEFVS
jgi:hypothetical protein